METFEEILGKVLQACEGLDEKEMEVTLTKLLEEEGLDAKEMGFVNETFTLLDESAAKYESLQNARKQGDTRQEWLAAEFDRMLEGRSEEEVTAVMETLEKGTDIDVEGALEEYEKNMEAESPGDVESEKKEEE